MNRYFTIANFLLITAGVYLCVSTFYTFVTGRLEYGVSSRAPSGQVSSAPAAFSKAPLTEYEAITTRNIFNSSTGEAESAPVAEKVDIDKLKQTELKLKLWGTVSGQDERAYAVIEDTKAREQNLYRAGDSIQNAVVKLILREKVVLRVDGRDEILAMEEMSSSSRGGSRVGLNREFSSMSTSPKKLPVSSYPRKIRLRGDEIQQAMENLGQLMEQATLRPHIENGQPAGISITGIKPNAIFRKMRLRNGDVITGVNGNSIESVEDAVKVVEQLSSGSNIQLQIKRRGREQTLDYSIE
ncbi:MAG: PDZ domain-containing protein [Desulfobacterales bacterium]|nr:MAG: PDZ domain-containing protein [Desulfobacterales bacterium]